MNTNHDHCHDDNCNCSEEDFTITLTLDDGTELECTVLATFPVGEKEYVALLPMNQTEEEQEVFLYQYKQLENEELELLNIEDDAEYDAVADAFDELLDEEEFFDMEEQEDE